MSDTKITPDERARWLSEAQPKNIDYYEPIDFELDKRIRNLIEALEQAESRAEKSEAENTRLTKERDWLSEKCAMHCHDKDGDEMCSYDTCGMFNCWHVSECEWKEAARKSVDGEGK